MIFVSAVFGCFKPALLGLCCTFTLLFTVFTVYSDIRFDSVNSADTQTSCGTKTTGSSILFFY